MSEVERCQEFSYANPRYPVRCGRPVKADGLCGPHLAGRKRSDAALARERERLDTSNEGRGNAEALIDRLTVLGIDAKPYYHVGFLTSDPSRYTGDVVIDSANVEKILRLLEDME